MIASWGGCREDLRHSLKGCELIGVELAKPEADKDLISYLWTAAVINYTRPFQADSRYPLPDELLAALSTGARQHHDVMMATRNKHLAHSENTMETVLPVIELQDPDTGDRKVKRVGIIHIRRQFTEPDVDKLKSLVQEVMWYLDQAVVQVCADAKKHLQSQPVDEIYAEPSVADLQMEMAEGPRERRRRDRGGSDPIRLS